MKHYSIITSFSLAIILLLAAVLRFIGLKWGIPTLEIPHSPFHPDEGWAMSVMQNLELAYADGSLNYYIWTFVSSMLKYMGIIGTMPDSFNGYGKDYWVILYASRVVVVLFDLLSAFFVFLTLRKITKNDNTALLGTFIFVIIPFEIIYAHYMRNHIAANFFVVVIIYYSLFIYDHVGENIKLYAFIGFLCGLATTIRYTTGIAVAIPFMMLVYKQFLNFHQMISLTRKTILTIFKTLILGIFTFLGIFVVIPCFFLDFDSKKQYLSFLGSATAKNEFYLSNLLDLSRVWVYIRDLIPHGTLPGLWIIFYFSVIYLLFRKQYYRYTIPLILFIPIYMYPMAKGYFSPMFIRAMLVIFPVFAILSAIAIADLMQLIKTSFHQKSQPCFAPNFSHYAEAMNLIVCALVSAILLSTLAYDFAYVKGMNHDPRIALYHYLKDEPKSELRIGIYPNGHENFVITPTLSVLPNKKVTFVAATNIQEGMLAAVAATIPGDFPANPLLVDYVLISAFTRVYPPYNHFEFARQKIAELTAKHYTLVKVFETPLSLGPIIFSHENNPSGDLQYPFPVLYLLKPRS